MTQESIETIRAAIQGLTEKATQGGLEFDSIKPQITTETSTLVSALVELEYLRKDKAAIEAILDKEEQRTHCGYAGKFTDRVSYVIAHYRNLAEQVLENSKDFRNDTANWLRAMRIVADSVGSASTHAEKSARLRGMVEILDWATAKLDSMEFTLQWAHDWPDLWRSDYPTRQYVDRIHQLEAQVKELTRQPKPEADKTEDRGAGGLPF